MLCDGCGAVGATQKCANCHKTWYCNKECQKAHWKLVHKKICGKSGYILPFLFGEPIANPLGSMRPGTEQWVHLSSRERAKALGRFDQMFKGFEKAENRSDFDAAVQSLARRYPVCAAEDCEKTSRFRCERCDSDTEKYCSIECQGADYSRHKHKCVQDTVGAATHASKE